MRKTQYQSSGPLMQIPLSSLHQANNISENNLETKQLTFRLSSNSQSSYIQFNKQQKTVCFNTSSEKRKTESESTQNHSIETPKNKTKTFVSHNASHHSSGGFTKNGQPTKRGGLIKVQDFDYKNSKKRFEFSKGKTRKLSQLKKGTSTSPRLKYTSKQKPNLLNQMKKQNQLKPALIKLQDFEIGKRLGKGKFGEVYLVRNRCTGFLCAMKIILKSVILQEDFVDQFVKQLKIQTYLNHPNIVKMYGFFSDIDKIYVLLQYCSSGSVYDRICGDKKLTQNEASNIVGQILTGLDELHYHKILHRDIKPQNILIEQGSIKIADFGWSTAYQTNRMRRTLCGTPLYLSPQILTGVEYGQKIDIWSVGIMTYEMIVSRNPFKIKTQNHLIRIIEQQINLNETSISSKAKDFLEKALNKNPSLRYEASQLLNHPFIKSI